MQSFTKPLRRHLTGPVVQCLMLCWMLSACHSAPVRDVPYQPPAQYLTQTPEPVAPERPVTNNALAHWIVDWRASLGVCNADKAALFDLFSKLKEVK